MAHVQDSFRKSLSTATFERKLSSVSLPLELLQKERKPNVCAIPDTETFKVQLFVMLFVNSF